MYEYEAAQGQPLGVTVAITLHDNATDAVVGVAGIDLRVETVFEDGLQRIREFWMQQGLSIDLFLQNLVDQAVLVAAATRAPPQTQNLTERGVALGVFDRPAFGYDRAEYGIAGHPEPILLMDAEQGGRRVVGRWTGLPPLRSVALVLSVDRSELEPPLDVDLQIVVAIITGSITLLLSVSLLAYILHSIRTLVRDSLNVRDMFGVGAASSTAGASAASTASLHTEREAASSGFSFGFRGASGARAEPTHGHLRHDARKLISIMRADPSRRPSRRSGLVAAEATFPVAVDDHNATVTVDTAGANSYVVGHEGVATTGGSFVIRRDSSQFGGGMVYDEPAGPSAEAGAGTGVGGGPRGGFRVGAAFSQSSSQPNGGAAGDRPSSLDGRRSKASTDGSSVGGVGAGSLLAILPPPVPLSAGLASRAMPRDAPSRAMSDRLRFQETTPILAKSSPIEAALHMLAMLRDRFPVDEATLAKLDYLETQMRLGGEAAYLPEGMENLVVDLTVGDDSHNSSSSNSGVTGDSAAESANTQYAVGVADVDDTAGTARAAMVIVAPNSTHPTEESFDEDGIAGGEDVHRRNEGERDPPIGSTASRGGVGVGSRGPSPHSPALERPRAKRGMPRQVDAVRPPSPTPPGAVHPPGIPRADTTPSVLRPASAGALGPSAAPTAFRASSFMGGAGHSHAGGVAMLPPVLSRAPTSAEVTRSWVADSLAPRLAHTAVVQRRGAQRERLRNRRDSLTQAVPFLSGPTGSVVRVSRERFSGWETPFFSPVPDEMKKIVDDRIAISQLQGVALAEAQRLEDLASAARLRRAGEDGSSREESDPDVALVARGSVADGLRGAGSVADLLLAPASQSSSSGAAAAHALAVASRRRDLRVPQGPPPSLALEERIRASARAGLVDWSWDVREFIADLCPSNYLAFFVDEALERWRLPEVLALDRDKIARYMASIEYGYHRRPTYHTAMHATDATHSMVVLLHGYKFQSLGSTERLAAILAPAVHDFAHPGVNNAFLENTRTPLSDRYNNHSILESFHIAAAFEVLHALGPDDPLADLHPDDYGMVRHLMIEIVMGTDFSRSLEIINRFRVGVLEADAGHDAFWAANGHDGRRALLRTPMFGAASLGMDDGAARSAAGGGIGSGGRVEAALGTTGGAAKISPAALPPSSWTGPRRSVHLGTTVAAVPPSPPLHGLPPLREGFVRVGHLSEGLMAPAPPRPPDVAMALTMAMKVADLGHVAKPFVQHLDWSRRCVEEFYRQGRDERVQGLKPLPFMDEAGVTTLHRSQAGFIKFAALPVFETFAEWMPEAEVALRLGRANHDQWMVLEDVPAAWVLGWPGEDEEAVRAVARRVDVVGRGWRLVAADAARTPPPSRRVERELQEAHVGSPVQTLERDTTTDDLSDLLDRVVAWYASSARVV